MSEEKRKPTFKENCEEAKPRLPFDRQNTLWMEEISGKCDHEWQPVTLQIIDDCLPDFNNAKCFVVCLKCRSWTYYELGKVTYYMGSPDDMEDDIKDKIDGNTE